MGRRRQRPHGRRAAGLAGVVLAAGSVMAAMAVLWPATPNGTGGATAERLTIASTSSSPATPTPTIAASPTPSQTSKTPTPTPTPHSTATPSSSTATTTAAGGGAAAAAPGDRLFTLVNDVQQTIWVAATQSSTYPLAASGWELQPGQSTTISVPDHWGGRVWGRTGCTFDASGSGHCQTGDCGGRFQCTGSGAVPATLAEIDLDAWDGLDFYDVSMVDGSNLPMYINISDTTTPDPVSADGCSSGGCTSPVACPSGPMRVTAGGRVVACQNACAAFDTDAYCCRGSWAGRTDCDPAKWPVDYAEVFKRAEPYAYSYAYDDSATMSCKGDCDYRITFGVTP